MSHEFLTLEGADGKRRRVRRWMLGAAPGTCAFCGKVAPNPLCPYCKYVAPPTTAPAPGSALAPASSAAVVSPAVAPAYTKPMGYVQGHPYYSLQEKKDMEYSMLPVKHAWGMEYRTPEEYAMLQQQRRAQGHWIGASEEHLGKFRIKKVFRGVAQVAKKAGATMKKIGQQVEKGVKQVMTPEMMQALMGAGMSMVPGMQGMGMSMMGGGMGGMMGGGGLFSSFMPQGGGGYEGEMGAAEEELGLLGVAHLASLGVPLLPLSREQVRFLGGSIAADLDSGPLGSSWRNRFALSEQLEAVRKRKAVKRKLPIRRPAPKKIPTKVTKQKLDVLGKAAQAFRFGGIAVSSLYGTPSVMKALGKNASGVAKFINTVGGSAFMQNSFGGKSGGLVVRDNEKVFKLMQDKAGQLVGQEMNLDQLPQPLHELPNNIPVPATGESGSMERTALVAGSGGLQPGGDWQEDAPLGREAIFDQTSLLANDTAMRMSQIDPYGPPENTTPMQDALVQAAVQGEKSLMDLIEEGKTAPRPESILDDNMGEDYSLRAELGKAQSYLEYTRKRARKMGQKQVRVKGGVRRYKTGTMKPKQTQILRSGIVRSGVVAQRKRMSLRERFQSMEDL